MSNYRFAICEWCSPVSGPAVCRLASEAGLEGVELNIGDIQHNLPLSDARVQRYYMDAAQKYGIAFTAMAVNTLDNYTTLHPENRAESEMTRLILGKAVEAAAAMGIPIVQVPNFFNNEIRSEQDMRAAAQFLRHTCELAEAHGIIVGSENTLTAEDNLKLVALVDRPNFRIYFDTENPVFFKKENSAEMIRKLGGHICEVHVKDGTDDQLSCRPLGQGHGHFYECVQALKDIGYSGWIVSENNYDMPPFNTFENDRFELIVEDLRIMKRAFCR